MKTAVIIPSRLGSERLPRKPLHQIAGVTLVERVWKRTSQAENVDAVIIATDSEEIAHVVSSFGGTSIMTSESCQSGTDRVAQAAAQLGEDYDIVINVQGDEPLVEPSIIAALARALQGDSSLHVATPVKRIENADDLENRNVVKVVVDSRMNGLYFSRQPIPYNRDLGEARIGEWLSQSNTSGIIYYKHLGLYAYRRSALEAFQSLPESTLERSERLEQLRLLEAGIPIRCIETVFDSIAVDTIEDVAKVEARLAQ